MLASERQGLEFRIWARLGLFLRALEVGLAHLQAKAIDCLALQSCCCMGSHPRGRLCTPVVLSLGMYGSYKVIWGCMGGFL